MNMERTGRTTTEFGARLLREIEAAGMSRAEFARKVGVSHVTVGRWINGRIPEATLIDAIADVLVLDYDLVAEWAGYRPRLPREHLDSIHTRLDPRLRKVQWSESRYRMVEAILDQMLADDAIRDNVTGATDHATPQ